MNLIQITGTPIQIAPIGLGTANYGTSINEQTAFRQLDRFTEQASLIDTAHIYGDWVPGIYARSERVIGKWLKQTAKRNKIVLCTKGAHPKLDSMHEPRLSPVEIRKDLENSLRCLQTDYIDFYFLHRDDPCRPVEEVLDVLEILRNEGKIRYFGCSNWQLSRIKKATLYAKQSGLHGLACNQLMWSLARINNDQVIDKSMAQMDEETFHYHSETQLSAMGYMALAKGYFNKRAAQINLRDSTRRVYDSLQNDRIFEYLIALSEQYGLSITTLTMLYFNNQPFPAIPLVSFSRSEQMEDCLNALSIQTPKDLEYNSLYAQLLTSHVQSL